MAQQNLLLWIVIAVMVLQFTGTVDFGAILQSSTPAEDEGAVTTGTESPESVVCSADRDETGRSRIKDSVALTTTYISGSTVYALNGEEIYDNNATTTSTSPGFGSHDSNVECGSTYRLWAPVQTGVAGSTSLENVLATSSGFKATLETMQISPMQLRVEDISADSFLYMNDSLGTNSSSFRLTNATRVFADVALSDIAVGQDGDLDYQFWIRANDQNKILGDDGEKMWMTVDIGTDVEWQEPTVSIDGVQLSNQIAEIDADSKLNSYVSAADYAYVIGKGEDYGRSIKKIGFHIQTQSGENPDTSNDDITVCIVGEGQYLSNDEADTIKTGIATDASGAAFIVPAATRTPCFTLEIS